LREDWREKELEVRGDINRHTSASRIQWSTRRWELRQGNRGQVEEDFGPSELTVEALYGN